MNRHLTTRRALAAALAFLGLALLAGLWHYVTAPDALRITATDDAARVSFAAEKARVFLPDDCVVVTWRAEGAERIIINALDATGEGQRHVCVTSTALPRMEIRLPDGTARVYTLPVGVAVQSMRFWLLAGGGIAALLVALLLAGISPVDRAVAALRARPVTTARALLGAAFVLWALVFILQTSFSGIEGDTRYFSLHDDAMISMRYAWNLAHGEGLVWNPGERVEGYSNLLWVLVMTPVNAIFEKRLAVLSMQLLGIPLLLGIAALTATAAEKLFLRPTTPFRGPLRVLFFALPLLYYPLAFWTLLGMETGLLTLLALATLVAAIRWLERGRPRGALAMGLLAGLTYLTRQDGLLLVLPVLGYAAFRRAEGSSWRGAARAMVAPALLLAAAIIGQQLFRLAYYEEWVPNTYRLKVEGIPFTERISGGVDYVLLFLDSARWLLPVLLVALVVNFRAEKALVAAIFGLVTLYQVYIGGDAWVYWRMFAPAMPLVLAWLAVEVFAAARALAHLAEAAAINWRFATWQQSALALLAIGLIVFPGLNSAFFAEQVFLARPLDVDQNARNGRQALALNEILKPDATVGVAMAGTLPYYTGRPAVDFLGKTDPHIAGLPPDLGGHVAWTGMVNVPGHIKYDMHYSVQELRPTYIDRCAWAVSNVCDWTAEHYVTVFKKGQFLLVDAASDEVLWQIVQNP